MVSNCTIQNVNNNQFFIHLKSAKSKSFLDVCAYLRCGLNSECVAKNHKGMCQCRSGYEGDANDLRIGCRPELKSCKSSSECDGNCYENICRRKRYDTNILNCFKIILKYFI